MARVRVPPEIIQMKREQKAKEKTPVMVACTAINFALHLNELPQIMNALPTKILRESIRRRLGGPPRKMTEMRPRELRKVVRRWGFGRSAWRRLDCVHLAPRSSMSM